MQTIYSRFAKWVGRYSDAPAIVEDGRSVSYRQLNTLANAIMDKFYDMRPKAVGIVMQCGPDQPDVICAMNRFPAQACVLILWIVGYAYQ